MLRISSGHSADYLLNEVATGRESYYTGAVAEGEPPGRWSGAGARALGLRGLVDAQDMTAVYAFFVDPRDEAFREPQRWGEAATLGHTGRNYQTEEELYAKALDAEPGATPERRAELRLEAGKKAQHNVAFHDATFSVTKSITVLHTAFEAQEVKARNAGDEAAAAAWGEHRQAVEDAIWAGNQAALDYLAGHAGYSRAGKWSAKTAGRYVDAHEWTVASFFQHDSRNHDPNLHIHNAILNRVQCADGQWRTLDGAALYTHRGAAAAVAERTTEERLTRALGVWFATRPDGTAREVVGIRESVLELLSSRRRAITAKTAELVGAFEVKFGREPNGKELDRLAQQATLATRKAKSHTGETREQMLERVDRQLRGEVDSSLGEVARDVLDLAGQPPEAGTWDPAAVIETALADVQAKKAAWTASDLTRAINAALPDYLGTTDGAEVARLLDSLTEQALTLAVALDTDRPGTAALPDELRLANGESVYQAPGARLYATPEHVHTERLLQESTAHGGAAAVTPEVARRFVQDLAEAGIELGADQAAAVQGVLCSGAQVESLVGPAGTGKSFVVGALAKAWQDPALWDGEQHRVIGLAASQIATDVLAGEGLTARNITRWLAAQRRLAAGTPTAEDHELALREGDLVVIDESSMANSPDLVAICNIAAAARAKGLLTGDHHQLGAFGAGGGMELMATAGASYELTEARRFTHHWEREASLRLRAADQTVLGEYHAHGRLLDAGAVEQAEASAAKAWLADTLSGRHSLVIVDTNDQAARLSAQIRADLVRLGQVTEHGVPLGLQGTYAGVGDLVQARLNGWHLAGFEGNQRGPINREHYRVLDTREDGGLVVAPILGHGPEGETRGETMTLPGSYVAGQVALGYASTVHSAQGLTVDTSHPVITPRTGADALYVGLSRGRHANTAHVVTRAVGEDVPTGTVNEAVHRSPAAVLAGILETADPPQSALATATEAQQDAESVRTAAALLADAAALATAGRTATWLDGLVDDGHLTGEQRAAIAAEDGGPTLTRILRRAELAGHDARQVLVDAVTDRDLGDVRQLSNVIHHRIATGWALDPVGDSYADWTPQVENPQWAHYLATLAVDADTRARVLGELAAAEAPQWAVEALGAPPAEQDAARDDWITQAGIVAAYREQAGHTDPEVALDTAPKPGQVEAYAAWRAAWRALGRPDAARDEVEMSDGQLRLRVRAWDREQAWSPRWVGNELAGTIQAAEHHRQTATLRTAEAQATTDPDHRARLELEATQSAALADTLDKRATELHEVEEARGYWLAHTAGTRAAADRATAELSTRRAADERVEEPVTAEEWLTAHDDATRAEDAHREITDEADLADVTTQQTRDLAALDHDPELATENTAGTEYHDVRDVAAAEPAQADEDIVRVPTAEETAQSIQDAQRALAEIAERRALDEARDAEQARAAQLARWHAEDQAAETARDQAAEYDDAAAMGGGPT